MINKISTDNQWGYSCWNEDAVATYLNTPAVQKALHIDDAWLKQSGGNFQWTDCKYNFFKN